ncbi:MAG: hypothetical protein ACREEW_17505, partial [Caulobacteraceae bacterium]
RQLTQGQIAARIEAAGVAAAALPDGAAVLERLERTLTGEEVVLLLSSGPLDGLAESLPALLDQRFGAAASQPALSTSTRGRATR